MAKPSFFLLFLLLETYLSQVSSQMSPPWRRPTRHTLSKVTATPCPALSTTLSWTLYKMTLSVFCYFLPLYPLHPLLIVGAQQISVEWMNVLDVWCSLLHDPPNILPVLLACGSNALSSKLYALLMISETLKTLFIKNFDWERAYFSTNIFLDLSVCFSFLPYFLPYCNKNLERQTKNFETQVTAQCSSSRQILY